MARATQRPGPQSDEAARLAEELRATTERQARAADPGVSAWVSANAGTGKTHVLTSRVLRLLVAGTEPERLLCLTYTKAAAAEMSGRVFERLAGWVTAPDETLLASLRSLMGRDPDDSEKERARELFTRAIETPGGLKVQTIHAFCEQLLQRFPLEAGIPPGFRILDEAAQGELVAEATRAVLVSATGDPGSPLGRALQDVVAFAHEDGFAEVLRAALSRRDWLGISSRLEFSRLKGLDAAAAIYRRGLDLDQRTTHASLQSQLASVLPDSAIARARDVLRASQAKTDQKHAELLAAALAATSEAARIGAFAKFFLKTDGNPRDSLMTKAVRAAEPDLAARLAEAQGRFHVLCGQRTALTLADATVALLRLADAVMVEYADLKCTAAALDFDDLIRTAGDLLRFGENAAWVLYKLDGGLDHILVDEAQDTSPHQWHVAEALAREFFSGLGARETDPQRPRTVFAVGDEKQSIYGFQGAAPHMFADMGRKLGSLACATHAFEHVPLTLSFRSVPPVLACVDRVFAGSELAGQLTSAGEPPRHVANRLGHAGLVELWETEKPDPPQSVAAFAPLDEEASPAPVARLATRIAATIESWLRNGERLASEDRPIRAGDILILVRRRKPFADAMVAALKARGIAVAGADRLRLLDQIVIKDVLAILDFLLLPEDDLALAGLLKSPFFDLDDDDLLALAPERRGSLWSALLRAVREGTAPRFGEAAARLKDWRGRADVVPPYELLVEILVHAGMRKRLLARLGPDAADPLDELLALALDYDDQEIPSLQGFVHWLRSTEREIKRDMDHGRDEVRVMTVHGSKGLEAPIVLLPDTCGKPVARRNNTLLASPDMAWPSEETRPELWPVKGTSGLAVVQSARAALAAAETAEQSRLLYVALTRARDRLYITGFEGESGRAEGCWYERIETALGDILEDAQDAEGRRLRRLASPQTAPVEKQREAARRAVDPETPPDWARTPAPRERALAVPLVPSRLAPLEVDAEGDPIEPPPRTPHPADGPPAPSPQTLATGHRFLRGTITHGLLQHLPTLPAGKRRAAAEQFVAVRGSALAPAVRASIVAETLAVLDDSDFADVFGPQSRAEVPVAAVLPSEGDAPPVHITGQIDRLVVTDHACLIVDYKTNRPPPRETAQVPDAYVLQLAAYRLAVSRVFPGLPVRAALLWTDGPHLMELPAAALDAAAERLRSGRVPHLDAP
jgi:ATP-dependent helicase/nuclease subunit A